MTPQGLEHGLAPSGHSPNILNSSLLAWFPTHQYHSPNKTPKSNRGRSGPEYSLKKKKKDRFLIYKSSRCTEFSLKKIVIHNKYSTKKKTLSYSTSFVSEISKRGMVGWRQEYREDAWEEEGRPHVLFLWRDGGGGDLSYSLVHAHTQNGSGVCTLWMGRRYFGTLA